MAKFISKSQMEELEDACTFGIEGANKLLKKYAGIQARAYTAYNYYDELMVMLRAGIISDLRLQQQFTLQESYMTETGERIRAVRYTADFSYRFGGKLVVEDVKSTATRTKEYLRNRKFMRSKFGIEIQEV